MARLHEDDGLTLVEILVAATLFIITGLLTVSIPLAGRDVTGDAEAQANVTAAVDAALVGYARDGQFTTNDQLNTVNARLVIVNGSTAPTGGEVSVALANEIGAVGVAAVSQTGACWLGRSDTDGAVFHALAGAVDNNSDGVADYTCTGVSALNLPTIARDGVGDRWNNAYVLSINPEDAPAP